MAWEVIAVEAFEAWLLEQDEAVQVEAVARVLVLREFGPQLGRPHVDSIKGSAFTNMKELRFKVANRPIRVLFAFDPDRRAVLLVGGDKGKDRRWYVVNVPVADERFRAHLASMQGEG